MTQYLGLLRSHHFYQLIDLRNSGLYLHYRQLHTQLSRNVNSVHNLVGPYTRGNGYQASFSNYHTLVKYD